MTINVTGLTDIRGSISSFKLIDPCSCNYHLILLLFYLFFYLFYCLISYYLATPFFTTGILLICITVVITAIIADSATMKFKSIAQV